MKDWEITVGDSSRWLDKLERLESRGAKLLHLKNLLASEKKALLNLCCEDCKEKLKGE